MNLSGCYYDNEEDLYPVSKLNCDTADMHFNANIFPVIQNRCNACHSAQNAPSIGGGIPLETYNQIKAAVDNGTLYGSVSGNPDYYLMPKDQRLDNCTILCIKAWIDKGGVND